MTPEAKFHALVLGFTVSVMFAVLTLVVPWVEHAPALGLYGGTAIALLASGGAYGLLSKGLAFLLGRVRWLKALILGAHYLEGTWVGFFRGHGGHIRYVVEIVQQDLSSLRISGRSYTTEGELHGQWSTDAVSLDAERGRLIFASSADFLTRGVTVQSVGVFQLERPSPGSAATAIEGYVADLVDGVRIAMREEKVSSRHLGVEEALRKAKEMADRVLAATPAVPPPGTP